MESRATEHGSGSLIQTELKDVTILFADIVNSTRLIEAMDPERASEALDPVLTIMIEAVHSHGGIVNRIQGDGVMAIFGAPSSLEEHAVQACFAALEMIEHMNRHDAGGGEPIQIRVGIDSGQVLVRTYEADLSTNYDAVGFVVHLANKMEAEANPNTAFLSGRTERLARGFIVVEAAGRFQLENSEYEVFQLCGRTQISRWTARESRVLCRVIGREPYLQRLKSRIAAIQQKSGSSILLEGEAGVGKSRLLYEFSNLCREQNISVLRVEGGLHQRKTLFQPFKELFAEQLDIGNQEDISGIDEKLLALLTRYNLNTFDHKLALGSLFNPNIHFLEPKWRRADPNWRRHTVIKAVVDVLAAMARETPLVLIVEDVHLMDGGSTYVVRRIAELAREIGLLLIVSQRSDQAESMARTEADHFIPIDPLSQKDALELCDALLGSNPALGPLKEALVHRTGGVPLFLEEIVLNLLEAGAIRGAIGDAMLGADPLDVGTMRLPSSVTSILSARIDRLASRSHAGRPGMNAAGVKNADRSNTIRKAPNSRDSLVA